MSLLSFEFFPPNFMSFEQCFQFVMFYMTNCENGKLFKNYTTSQIAEIIAKYWYIGDNKYKIIRSMTETFMISGEVGKIIGFNKHLILWTSRYNSNMLSNQ